jgi:hypothetical protein
MAARLSALRAGSPLPPGLRNSVVVPYIAASDPKHGVVNPNTTILAKCNLTLRMSGTACRKVQDALISLRCVRMEPQ